jgi:hypothetical protein
MALISSSIPNLVNGVSQQPYTLRLASQAELQENGLSTTSQGLRKRPPTKHLKKLLSGQLGNAYIHTINRDENERYTVVITNGELRVFDILGTEKTVNFPNGKGYLSATSPESAFRAVTVADYTFLLNKTISVTERTSRSTTRDSEALVSVKVGNYGKTYRIKINGSTVSSYTTPDGSNASHTASISTDYIASQLMFSLSGYPINRYGSVIHIQKHTGDFDIEVEDGFNNGAMTAIKGQIQKFADLPANAGVNNFAVEVIGDKNNGFDNFWVRFDDTGTGSWKETLKPNELLGYTASTMPHTLVREANGTFTFAPAAWADRAKGTANSNPNPSFVGRKISDIFFYRNRLGFLVDESVCMSEAGEFFNFYRTTVTELLDADPIDVTVSHTKVSSLLHAVPYNKQLLLFSAQTQFVVDAGDQLTPKTISIKQSTEFECNPDCEPIGVGNNIYFPVPKGRFTGVREYFTVDDVSGTNDAADITSHVPSYIAGDVFKIAAGLNENILVLLSRDDRSAAWVYKFYWDRNEKLQSSWSKWTFGPGVTILNADFILSELYLIIQRSDGVYLEVLSVATGDIGVGEPYNIHLDRKVRVSKDFLTYDGGSTNIPQAYLPGSLVEGEWEAVIPGGQASPEGTRLPVFITETGARVPGNFTGNDLIVGMKYVFRYKFSPITVKVAQGNAQKSDTIGRLQLRNMVLNYADSGYFKVLVNPLNRGTYEYVFTGKTLGLPSTTVGGINLDTGLFKFPILSRNIEVGIEVMSDAPLPVSLLSADWEGMYVKRSKTV